MLQVAAHGLKQRSLHDLALPMTPITALDLEPWILSLTAYDLLS